MRFCFKILFIFTFLSQTLMALELKSFYLSSCQRETGVIVDANRSHLYILSIEGKAKKIARYEIFGIATYPLSFFLSSSMKITSSRNHFDTYSIKTQYKGKLVSIVEGWPIDYSQNRITFLSTEGEEVTFGRNKIWDIQKKPTSSQYTFKQRTKKSFRFLHPTSMRKCPYSKFKKPTEVVPQTYISDPISLKRELDRYIKEKKIINGYIRSQKFYPKPEVYSNRSSLGMWFVAGSRHGQSENRSNNWAPVLENQLSSGPFGFQHLFKSGASTNEAITHEETQTQIYYKAKADYFHFSFFFDPSTMLVGDRYRWFDQEISSKDFRINDETFTELGLDFAGLSLTIAQSSTVRVGLKTQDNFFYDTQISVSSYGASYDFSNTKINFLIGSGSEKSSSDDIFVNGTNIGFEISNIELDFMRVNLKHKINEKYTGTLSYISRSLNTHNQTYENTTLATEFSYNYSYKYMYKSLFSFEKAEEDQFIKVGLSAHLVF